MISRLLMVALVLGSVLSALPPNFDARDVWPTCLGPVYDQGGCNSSWAITAASVASDRYCIAKKVNVALSPQMLISCVVKTCEGPFSPDPVMSYMANPGLPTRQCVKYTAAAGECPTKCDDGSALKNYACKANAIKGEDAIKTEIMTNGPVLATFMETIDFKDYYDGIYYHAHPKKPNNFPTVLKLVGWGVENGINYWIAQHSVGPSFGENGYVRHRIMAEPQLKEFVEAFACTPTS
jgi:cathepsin B